MSYLFSPISIRGEIIKNRVFVSPMCQYSSEQMDGTVNDWHKVHLGTRVLLTLLGELRLGMWVYGMKNRLNCYNLL
jgi:hypothetical protein